MSEIYNNAANPTSEGSVRGAIIWISMVVAVAFSALYLALSDVSATSSNRVAIQVGATSGHDANKLDAFAYQEPFGIDQSVMTKQDAPR